MIVSHSMKNDNFNTSQALMRNNKTMTLNNNNNKIKRNLKLSLKLNEIASKNLKKNEKQ